jgi:hypothetical protein
MEFTTSLVTYHDHLENGFDMVIIHKSSRLHLSIEIYGCQLVGRLLELAMSALQYQYCILTSKLVVVLEIST